MKVHDLKCVNPHFATSWYRLKPWELRLNDRDFKLHDFARLKEYDPTNDSFSGRVIVGQIEHILFGHLYPELGISSEHVIFTLSNMLFHNGP